MLMSMSIASRADAQSLLDRPPDVSGDWVGAPGTLYFHFVHRFTRSEPPAHKISNTPTFLLAAGLPKRFMLGLNYATNSTLSRFIPNETEYFARWAPVSQDFGAPVDVGGQIGYNSIAKGVDGEISVARKLGPARLIVAGRALSDPFEKNNERFAGAAGATIRLGQFFAIAGDVASLTNRDSVERVAWSAALQFAIPLTPHTFSLQMTNTETTTLQGASRGQKRVRYGFEFTIPLTLRRYIGKRAKTSSAAEPTDSAVSVTAAMVDSAAPGHNMAEAAGPVPVSSGDTIAAVKVAVSPVPVAVAPPPSVTPPAATKPVVAPKKIVRATAKPVRVVIKNIAYTQTKLNVTVGTTVEWVNDDPLQHSVTAVDKSFNSGLISPGKSFRHTFTKAGTYSFYCMPHPFMKGVIVVKEP
jgi:plastocyanin